MYNPIHGTISSQHISSTILWSTMSGIAHRMQYAHTPTSSLSTRRATYREDIQSHPTDPSELQREAP